MKTPSTRNPLGIKGAGEAGVNPTVLLFTLGATLLTGLAFGVVPAVEVQVRFRFAARFLHELADEEAERLLLAGARPETDHALLREMRGFTAFTESADPEVLAYFGSARTLVGRETWHPFTKLVELRAELTRLHERLGVMRRERCLDRAQVGQLQGALLRGDPAPLGRDRVDGAQLVVLEVEADVGEEVRVRH